MVTVERGIDSIISPYTLSQTSSSALLLKTAFKRDIIHSISKLSEPIVVGNLNRSLKRFLLLLVECNRQAAKRVCNVDTRLSPRF